MKENKNDIYLAGIKSQDSHVLTEIYGDILPGIKKWVKENGGNSEDAEDLFQEMIISIYKKVKNENFKLTCTFWSYSLVVCRNLWFAKNRNKGRMKYTDTINEDSVILDETIQYQIEQQEQFQLYRKHFLNLGSSCQKILSMFFAKVKMAEIAKKLKLSPAYVKKQKFNCKEDLIRRIKDDSIYEELKS